MCPPFITLLHRHCQIRHLNCSLPSPQEQTDDLDKFEIFQSAQVTHVTCALQIVHKQRKQGQKEENVAPLEPKVDPIDCDSEGKKCFFLF